MLRTAGVVAAAWVVVIGGYYLLPLDRDAGNVVLALIGGLTAFVGIAVWEVIRILRADLPQLRAAEAIGVLVPLFIVLFASIYLGLSTSQAGQFSEVLTHTDSLYFTITVLATVGFGDITAVSQGARLLVSVQMLLDIAIIATLAKVLIGAARVSLGGRPT